MNKKLLFKCHFCSHEKKSWYRINADNLHNNSANFSYTNKSNNSKAWKVC